MLGAFFAVGYVMAVACDEPVVVELPGLGVRRLEVRELAARLAPSDWQTLSMSQGSKGPRLFAWAIWSPRQSRNSSTPGYCGSLFW